MQGLEGVELAFIDGSWAARYPGEPGPVPADIDILVIRDVATRTVWMTVPSKPRAFCGAQVNIRRLRPSNWQSEDDSFDPRQGTPSSSCA